MRPNINILPLQEININILPCMRSNINILPLYEIKH